MVGYGNGWDSSNVVRVLVDSGGCWYQDKVNLECLTGLSLKATSFDRLDLPGKLADKGMTFGGPAYFKCLASLSLAPLDFDTDLTSGPFGVQCVSQLEGCELN